MLEEMLISSQGKRIPQKMIDEARNLKMVQIMQTGMVDFEPGGADRGFLLETLKGRGILLGNVSDSRGGNMYSASIAEEGFALILALAKRLIQAHMAYASGQEYPFNDNTWSVALVGKTLGIIGLGRLGRRVAKLAKAFDMRVIGTDKLSTEARTAEIGAERVYPPENLHEVLTKSDIVILTVPLTFETYGLIGEPELKAMKQTAYLVNIARAFLVQEGALFRALTEGWIAGFASDCWWDYHTHRPVPSPTGLHKLPNVIASNDRAAYTPECQNEQERSAFENIDDFAAGKRPRYLVDIELLY